MQMLQYYRVSFQDFLLGAHDNDDISRISAKQVTHFREFYSSFDAIFNAFPEVS